MKLIDYLTLHPEKGPALARDMGVSASILYQWKAGLRPVPVRKCLRLEQLTDGAVTRKDTRPSDWVEIWPELAEANPLAGINDSSAMQPALDAR